MGDITPLQYYIIFFALVALVVIFCIAMYYAPSSTSSTASTCYTQIRNVTTLTMTTGSYIINKTGVGHNHVFVHGPNSKRNSRGEVYVNFSASDFNVGDSFSITNSNPSTKVYLNPHGFSNVDTNGASTKYVLMPTGINTALIFITVGSTTSERNVNMVFTALNTMEIDRIIDECDECDEEIVSKSVCGASASSAQSNSV
jgi:hypothetical protein